MCGATLARIPMDCTLFIPHLLPPREQGVALWRTVDAPQLKTLLARAAFTSNAAMDKEAWLCGAFGIARQQDFPLAPVLANSENLRVDTGYWLNATPVHLETRRNALMLTDPAAFKIAEDESTAFVATLADHLREENLRLHAPQSGRWFLHSDTVPSMTTSSLATVTGHDVRPYLPHGTDSARWHRILTEIQMLLHAHPVNDAREARGSLPINSVWLWGGGTRPAPSSSPFTTVWSDDFIVRALAHHSGCLREPQSARITLETLAEGSHLFSFEWLEAQLRLGDAQAWSHAVTALNRDWFTPLMDALKARRLRSLTVINADQAGTQQFIIRPIDLMKIFRKNKYLQ